MNKKILLILAPFYFALTAFFSINQSVTLNNDGSGSLNLIYTGTIKEVEENKYALGNFPFGEKRVNEFFSSENVNIKSLKIAKPGDTAYMVILSLDFKDIESLNKLQGFGDMNIGITNDSGSVVTMTIKSNERTKFITVLNSEMIINGGVVSSNGTITGDTIKWYKTDFSKENVLTAKLKSNLPTTNSSTGNSDKQKESPPIVHNDDKKPEQIKEKKCSIFGLELPIILLGGLFYSYRRKKKRP